MINFVENYLQSEGGEQSEDNPLFNTNNVCILYFSIDEDEEYLKEILGTYPGDMNNFYLTSPADFWSDPEETFSNVYLDKKISENKDYLILNYEIYRKIRDCFGVFNEIERNSVFNKENLEIEIHLRKVNLLFINNTDKSFISK
jgi:hypothetical protein